MDARYSTTSSPSTAEYFRSMAKAYELKAQESERYVLTSDYGHYTQATVGEILDWSCGLNMPPMQPFGRWWLALSIKLSLPTTRIFKVDWSQLNMFRAPWIPMYYGPRNIIKYSV